MIYFAFGEKIHRCTGVFGLWIAALGPSERSPEAAEFYNNDPSAGSPTETLLRLLLPLNDQI